jgi:hypothetical protein
VNALRLLAASLRGEDSVISPHVGDPGAAAPALGLLAAAGPRAAAVPSDYALVIESVREGYLLHYGRGRVIAGTDPDLALLAGDYLYALGLERLAGLGDLDSVRELSDLISLAAQIHDASRPAMRAGREADALWLATVIAIGVGGSDAHQRAKSSLRGDALAAAQMLWDEAEAAAAAAGVSGELERAADAIDFRRNPLP